MATTVTVQKAPDNSTDAGFRAWGKALSDAFATLGLVKDTDAGQINWTSVLKPTGGNTVMGYEIWRFADALQASCPVYFKIQYGSGGTQTFPNITLNVGQGSDNAGSLTGTVSTTMTCGSGATSVTTSSCFMSSDTGRVNVSMFASGVQYQSFAFYIERLKDDAGINTSAGVNIVTWGELAASGTGKVNQQYLPLAAAIYPTTPMAASMCAMPSSGAGSYGSNIGLYPIYPNIGYAGNPDLGGLVYFTGDIASPGATISVTLFGVSHTFVTMGDSRANILSLNGNTTSHGLAVRYE